MKKREVVTIKMDSVSENEEFARVAVAVFLSRMEPDPGGDRGCEDSGV